MNLHNKNIEPNIAMELFEIKSRYLQNDSIEKASHFLMSELLEFFDLDRIYVGMNCVFENKCIPLIEYLKGEKPNFLSDIETYLEFKKITNKNSEDLGQEFVEICDKNNYFVGDEFKILEEVLPYISYLPSLKGNPNECLVFYTRTKETFSYIIFERYEKREMSLSKLEIAAITDIHNMIKVRIEKDTLEERLYNEINMKNIIIEQEQTPICVVGKKDMRILHFNEAYKKLKENVELGMIYSDLFDGDKNDSNLLENHESLIMQKNKNGIVNYWIKKVAPFTLASGQDVYMIYIKDTGDYIEELEGIDLLTSAYSSYGFANYFYELMEKNQEEAYVLGTFDISKFKYINDIYGFDVGNKILKRVANLFSSFIKDGESFCRMNEDRFAILLKYATNEEIKSRIKSFFVNLDMMKYDYFPDVELRYMCGITEVEKNIEINILIDRANIARKTVKGSHRSSVAFFDEELKCKMENEIKIEARTANAVENDEFDTFLQPKFNIQTQKICGAEALVRWITPDGMIFPDQFIPLFEKNDFICTVDFIVYNKVMKFIRKCLDKNLPVYPISVNVSRNHINDDFFIKKFLKLVKKYDVPKEYLELEITESVFVENKHILKQFVDEIKSNGFKISIDDFGSAYSSLQTLTDINVDVLKIDKGFLDNLADSINQNKNSKGNDKDTILLKNVINLAKELDFKVVCEGIETDEQMEILKNIGCEIGQGYIFAKPMPITEYMDKYII